ncbi:hypothetical protein HDU93_007932 [Gonapodya sp. JEL0774]|nr:hypothetical protein HDU93_007932 [Gonapodya sp. JEL0774]
MDACKSAQPNQEPSGLEERPVDAAIANVLPESSHTEHDVPPSAEPHDGQNSSVEPLRCERKSLDSNSEPSSSSGNSLKTSASPPAPSPGLCATAESPTSLPHAIATTIDHLPLEILQRVFRLLAPATFYKRVPRVSRRFHSAFRTAIPGCTGNEIGLCCTVVFTPASWVERQKKLVFSDRFREVSYGGRVIWTAFEMVQQVSARKIQHKGDVANWMEQELEDRALAKLSFSPRATYGTTYGASWKLVVSVARVGFTDNNSRYRMVTLDEVQKVMEFANARRIQEVSFEDLEALDQIGRLPPSMSMASIERIGVGVQATLTDIPRVSVSDVRLGTLMTRFPSASNIIGAPQCWVPDGIRTQVSPNGKESCVSPSRRNLVRSFRSLDTRANNVEDCLAILRVASFYENLSEFGDLWIHCDQTHQWDWVQSKELLELLSRVAGLKQIQRLHLHFTITSTFGDVLTIESRAQRAIKATRVVKHLTDLMPNLVHITATPHANRHVRSSSITALGEFAGALIRGVPENCTVEILKVAEAMVFIHDKDWLEVMIKEGWPKQFRGWDGRRSVIVQHGRARW